MSLVLKPSLIFPRAFKIDMEKKKVCVIGSGPSGMSFLHQCFKTGAISKWDVTCYEKQKDWGGQWNFTEQTGLDEFGEPVHTSMYKHLWSNTPKESNLEYPDYTFEDHFGDGSVPSFLPREAIYDYLKGRHSQFDLKKKIKFSHVIKNVKFDEQTKKFSIAVKDLLADKMLAPVEYDFVINCMGHYSKPYIPQFPGLVGFEGIVMHAQDVRNEKRFKGKDVLIIGSSFTAEDLALQIIKFGGKSVVCSYKTKPMGFDWPEQITEKPLVSKFVGNKATFKDGSTSEFDAVILATGYVHSYPCLEKQLRLPVENQFYHEQLYKEIVLIRAENGQFLYIGAPNQLYSFNMFDVQSLWAVKYMLGELMPASKKKMTEDNQCWMNKLSNVKDLQGAIAFQTDYVTSLARECGLGYNIDTSQIFLDWSKSKTNNILTYRDNSAKSIHTNKVGSKPQIPFFEAMDDSLECFLKNCERATQ